MTQKLIDCHAHLVGENTNAQEAINNMAADNLEAIIAVGTSPQDIKQVLSFAENNENIYAALAFHPEYASDIKEKDLKLLTKLSQNPKVVAIGECGLDYHYGTNNMELQKKLFVWHIKLAKSVKKPIMIHLRDAESDALKILKEHGSGLKDIIIHCYSSVSEEVTKQFVQMGCYLSFAGNFSFKNYRTEDIKLVPKDKILCETDSPYLAPVPLRGTINQPKNVHLVAKYMADALEMSEEKLKPILLQNARRVFEI